MTASSDQVHENPPRWKRDWNVTMRRCGLAIAVVLGVPMVLTVVFALVINTEPDSNYLAAIFGYMSVGPFLYLLLIGWWLDHLAARTGYWGSFAIHGGVSLTLAAIAFVPLVATVRYTGDTEIPIADAMLAASPPLVIWLVGWPLAHGIASKLRGSFAPRVAARHTQTAP